MLRLRPWQRDAWRWALGAGGAVALMGAVAIWSPGRAGQPGWLADVPWPLRLRGLAVVSASVSALVFLTRFAGLALDLEEREQVRPGLTTFRLRAAAPRTVPPKPSQSPAINDAPPAV